MLNVNNNSQIVSLYSVQTTSKTAATHSVTKTSSVDSASFSPEALKQLEISEFLKNKPHTGYRYNAILKNDPEKAEKFITEAMDTYGEVSGTSYITPASKLKELDDFAIQMGCRTPDDVRKKTEELFFYRQVQGFESFLEKSQQVQDTRASDKAQYGSMALSFLETRLDAQQRSYSEEWGRATWNMEEPELCSDRKIDPETGQIWLLPINSDTWVTKEDFVKEHPEYLATGNVFRDYRLAQSSGNEVFEKYIKNTIASFTEEQKTFAKNHHLLDDPAYRNLDIEGIQEFTKDYADFDKYHYYDKDASPIFTNPYDYEGDYLEFLKHEENMQEICDDELPEMVKERNRHLQTIGKTIGLKDQDVLDALTLLDFEIYAETALKKSNPSDLWKEMFLTNPDGTFKKDSYGKPIRNNDFKWSQEYEFLKHPYLIPKDNELAFYELLKPMKQSASSIDGLVEAVEKGDLFRYLQSHNNTICPPRFRSEDTSSFEKLYKLFEENEKFMKEKYPELMAKRNERFEIIGSHIGISDAEVVKELTNLDLKIFTERLAKGEDAESIWKTLFIMNEDGSFKKDETGKLIRNNDYKYSDDYEYLKGTTELPPELFREKQGMLQKIGTFDEGTIDHYLSYAKLDRLNEWVTLHDRTA